MAAERGGNAVVVARGDAGAGTILIDARDRTAVLPLMEAEPQFDDGPARWVAVGPVPEADPDGLRGPLWTDSARADYLDRRRQRDPDLWIVELDIPEPERFIAEWAAAS